MDVPQPSERAIRAALAHRAYAQDRVRLVVRDLRDFDFLIATRNGLFGANSDRVSLVAYGFFFGLHRHGDTIFIFEACGIPHTPSERGRLVALDLENDRIANTRVIARGLDNQCHQLAVINELICVVDTANQAIRRFTLDGAVFDVRMPLPPVQWGDRTPAYRHINSIAHVAGAVVLMLHNGAGVDRRPSELAWLDAEWQITRMETLAGYGCHDIVEDEEGVLWHCGSWDGELLRSNGPAIPVSTQMTRGLAPYRGGFVVGVSEFARRENRTTLGGGLLFLDRDMNRVAELQVDGAPTAIIPIRSHNASKR